MYIVATLQPLEMPAHLVVVPVTVQLGDLRKEAAQYFQWNANTAFYGACSIAMAVGELPCSDMYKTLADYGVTGDILVTLVRIPVPLSIVAAEQRMPDALQSIALAGRALRLWVSPYEQRTSQTMDFMTLADMQSEIKAAEQWLREKTHPVARGAAMANKCINRVLQSDIVMGGDCLQPMGELTRDLKKADIDTRDVMVMLCRGMSVDETSRGEFIQHAEKSYGAQLGKDLEACLFRSYHKNARPGGFPLLKPINFGGPRPRPRGPWAPLVDYAILPAPMLGAMDEDM